MATTESIPLTPGEIRAVLQGANCRTIPPSHHCLPSLPVPPSTHALNALDGLFASAHVQADFDCRVHLLHQVGREAPKLSL